MRSLRGLVSAFVLGALLVAAPTVAHRGRNRVCRLRRREQRLLRRAGTTTPRRIGSGSFAVPPTVARRGRLGATPSTLDVRCGCHQPHERLGVSDFFNYSWRTTRRRGPLVPDRLSDAPSTGANPKGVAQASRVGRGRRWDSAQHSLKATLRPSGARRTAASTGRRRWSGPATHRPASDTEGAASRRSTRLRTARPAGCGHVRDSHGLGGTGEDLISSGSRSWSAARTAERTGGGCPAQPLRGHPRRRLRCLGDARVGGRGHQGRAHDGWHDVESAHFIAGCGAERRGHPRREPRRDRGRCGARRRELDGGATWAYWTGPRERRLQRRRLPG